MMPYAKSNESRAEDSNGRKGYWAEDIVREMSPSMYEYDSNESYGWYAEPLIKKLSPSMYPEMNGRQGYWAEDILRESMPTMFGEDNDSHNESDYSENGGEEDGGYYAMDILAV